MAPSAATSPEHRMSHPANLPDREQYVPLFSPWVATQGEFHDFYRIAAPRTLVSRDRCHVLYTLLRQAVHVEGEVWECGVYRGGTAAMMARILKKYGPWKRLFLFDTFAGMPATDSQKDFHQQGDFADTSLESVQRFVQEAERCVYRQGFIPETFSGLESARIAFAHIDVDIYRSILDCLEFIWPRLAFGGMIVFDDYGFPTCPGAREAVDRFFSGKACRPLCLPTGQALVFKGAA